ncbi:atypical chemokine receptor 2 [Clarias gariepinus]
MDDSASLPANSSSNTSDYDYSDYYSLDALSDFRPCEKHQVKNFSRYFLPVFYSVACALGLAANVALVCVLARGRRVRRALPACALCADLLLAATFPFWAVYAARDWIFGAHACKTVTLAYAVGLYAGNLFSACAPLRSCLDAASVFRRMGDARKDAACCACVWTLACLAAAPHLGFVEERRVHVETQCLYRYTPGWKIYMRLQQALLVFGVPFLLLLGSSVATVLCARSSGFSGTVRRTVVFTALFFLLWFPYTLVLVLHLLHELHVVSECGVSLHLDFAIQGTECIAFSRVFINPTAYILLNKRAKRVLREACQSPREYLLDVSESTDSVWSEDAGVELRAVQNDQSFFSPDFEQGGAEKQGYLLPHAT